jgi:hypothetical protein
LWLLGLLGVAAVICNIPLAAFVGPWFALLSLAIVLAHRRQLSWRFLLLAVAPAVVVAVSAFVLLAGNYFAVGMAEATPFKLFFDHANQAHHSQFVSPYLWIFVEEATSETTGRILLDRIWSIDWTSLLGLLRFGIYSFDYAPMAWLLLLGALPLAFPAVRKAIGWPAVCLLLMLLSAGLASLFVAQPGSLYRIYIFTLPLNCMLFALAAVAASLLLGRYRHLAASAIALVAGLYLTTVAVADYAAKDGEAKLTAQLRFVAGAQSIGTSAGILTTCERMASTLPAAGRQPAKVWTLSYLLPVGCYLMPSPRVLMEVNVGFGPNWHRIVFGAETEALAEMAKLGVGYVYVNLADFDANSPLDTSSSLMGCLAYSPLFSPAAIARHFRVVWQEQDAFLLTTDMSAPAAAPVPDAFIGRWPVKRDTFQFGLGQMKQLCDRVAGYYAAQGEAWPVAADRSLPRVEGWQ